jgi:hypothetical protein
MVALIHLQLDYRNFVMISSPAHCQHLLQSALNTIAQLTARLRRYDHVTNALTILHWLQMPECVEYKLAVTVYHSLYGQPHHTSICVGTWLTFLTIIGYGHPLEVSLTA